MPDAETERLITNLSIASAVVLGAVVAGIAKAVSIDTGVLMNHLETVRRKWLEQQFGLSKESDGQLQMLMQYLEVQADFPQPSLPAVYDNNRPTPTD